MRIARTTDENQVNILRLLKWRWWFAGACIAGLTIMEFFEHDTWGINLFYDLELIIFICSILVIGTLFELLARTNRKLDDALRILDYKHKFNLELSQEEDWDTLTTRLVEFPHTLVDAVESALIFCNPDRGTNELAAHWGLAGHISGDGIAEGSCARCCNSNTGKLHLFVSYEKPLSQRKPVDQDIYCLPICDEHHMLAMLRFQMATDKKPPAEQVAILENIVDEMAISLKTSYERRIQAEMHIALANLTQRKEIWRYLHDHLGQNLAYLRLKLDQFSKMATPFSLSEVRTDLEHMRDVTDESYLMVRDWLESRHPQTQSQLADLLIKHAREMTKHEKLKIEVRSEGQPVQIDPSIQRKIFYIYREALANITRHAEASKAEVVLAWGSSDLTLNISDNGKGFTPTEINGGKHYGFGIMTERVAELQGRLELNTSPTVGTVISIWVPVQEKAVLYG